MPRVPRREYEAKRTKSSAIREQAGKAKKKSAMAAAPRRGPRPLVQKNPEARGRRGRKVRHPRRLRCSVRVDVPRWEESDSPGKPSPPRTAQRPVPRTKGPVPPEYAAHAVCGAAEERDIAWQVVSAARLAWEFENRLGQSTAQGPVPRTTKACTASRGVRRKARTAYTPRRTPPKCRGGRPRAVSIHSAPVHREFRTRTDGAI